MSPATIRIETEDLLAAVADDPGPAACARDVADGCEHDRDAVAYRLAELECKGLLASKPVNGVETWRLTADGRARLRE